MPRSTFSSSDVPYIIPWHENGTREAEDGGETGFVSNHGTFLLVAATTYYFPVGEHDAEIKSVHFQWDDAIVITSITVEDTCMAEAEASDFSDEGGAWIPETPEDAYVGVTPAAGATVTDGVVAVVGGDQGGAIFNIGPSGARRLRLAVVVGATGGHVRCSEWGKD